MAIKHCVSLYSLQEDYLLGKRDLEGCIAAAANEIGAEGIEVLFDQMPLPSFWETDRVISDADLDMWNGWMEKYHCVPRSYGSMIFLTMYSNRRLTNKENQKLIMKDMRAAAKLGFKVYRSGFFNKDDLKVLESCIPLAEDLGIQITTEIHSPRGIHTWWTTDWLEVIQRTGSKFAGFVLDFGIFTIGMSLAARKKYIRAGAKPEILDKIDEARRAQVSLTEDDIKKMGGGTVELAALSHLKGVIYDNPQWLKEVLCYSQHIHGKFYEMTEDCIEHGIDYENAIKVLVESDWDGYISSEYEGQRDYFEQGCDIYMDPVEQCRRFNTMIERFVKQAKKE